MRQPCCQTSLASEKPDGCLAANCRRLRQLGTVKCQGVKRCEFYAFFKLTGYHSLTCLRRSDAQTYVIQRFGGGDALLELQPILCKPSESSRNCLKLATPREVRVIRRTPRRKHRLGSPAASKVTSITSRRGHLVESYTRKEIAAR